MPHTTKDAVKEFLALAQKRLDECGNEYEVAIYFGNNVGNACTGCPGKGEFGAEYESCIYAAALDVSRNK